jgi:hypothetical protein
MHQGRILVTRKAIHKGIFNELINEWVRNACVVE